MKLSDSTCKFKHGKEVVKMIQNIIEIPITKESYPFASADRYLHLDQYGYEEVLATTDLRLLPTPGSTTETNTVPSGQ